MAQQFDRVVSYHHNIHTCGVARFNRGIADHLSIKMGFIDAVSDEICSHPLVSIKKTEISLAAITKLHAQLLDRKLPYSIIFHDYLNSELEQDLLKNALYVMALNREMKEKLDQVREDVILGFAPGSQPYAGLEADTELRLITFGMAHKINPSGYESVGQLLRAGSQTYRLEISSALHEGTQFDDDFFSMGEEISNYFGGNVDFLGFLADAEVSRRISRAHAMLAFFPQGARENNTSVLTALSHGISVITNLDRFSPEWMQHGKTVFEVSKLEVFPPIDELARIGRNAKQAVNEMTYETLVSRFG
jgi:glycosyltransferase involved in cell wall biosynthesis